MNRTLVACSIALATVAGTLSIIKYRDWLELSHAREVLASTFNDPSSTQFRNDRFEKNGWFCGEVNSKNREGGYVGFKRFASSGHPGGQYVEGHGLLGELSAQDFIDLMDKKIARLKSQNELMVRLPSLKPMSEGEVADLARNDIFTEKWEAFCR